MFLRCILGIVAAAALLVQEGPAQAQTPKVSGRHYRVYRADGSVATLADVIAASKAATVTFLGEEHDDPVAHYLEHTIFEQVAEKGTALSLEMFETDVQYVLDEFLAGTITEEHLFKSGRAWKNYADYKPMVELAKQRKLPVVAANAPRRYVNMVTRMGPESLLELSEQARAFLPPLPYAEASKPYAERFRKVMEAHEDKKKAPEVRSQEARRSLEAQSLWDAGMAYSVAQFLTRHPASRVVHVNGSFHSAQRQGILEHLNRYRPATSMVVVTMAPSKSFPDFDRKEMLSAGDFVIVTDASLARSFGGEGKGE